VQGRGFRACAVPEFTCGGSTCTRFRQLRTRNSLFLRLRSTCENFRGHSFGARRSYFIHIFCPFFGTPCLCLPLDFLEQEFLLGGHNVSLSEHASSAHAPAQEARSAARHSSASFDQRLGCQQVLLGHQRRRGRRLLAECRLPRRGKVALARGVSARLRVLAPLVSLAAAQVAAAAAAAASLMAQSLQPRSFYCF